MIVWVKRSRNGVVHWLIGKFTEANAQSSDAHVHAPSLERYQVVSFNDDRNIRLHYFCPELLCVVHNRRSQFTHCFIIVLHVAFSQYPFPFILGPKWLSLPVGHVLELARNNNNNNFYWTHLFSTRSVICAISGAFSKGKTFGGDKRPV